MNTGSTPNPSDAAENTDWIIEPFVPDTEYPDLLSYKILEPNPDAGKPHVSYSGKYFHVCTVDSAELAHLIAAVPTMFSALKEITTLPHGSLRIRLLSLIAIAKAQPEMPRESYTMRTPEKMAEVVAAIDPFQIAAIKKFFVVSYDPDQQQWFYDFVIAESEDKAEEAVCQARSYVIAAAATELPALARMAATLAQTPAHRIEQEFATLENVTDRRSTAVRP